jgi:cobalt-zinc-cadmium efflux system outer membrane protein
MKRRAFRFSFMVRSGDFGEAWGVRMFLASIVLAVAFGAAGRARGDDDRAAVTLDEVIAAAANAPAIRVTGYEIAAAQASADAAQAWPSPSLRVATNRLTARLVAGATVPLPVFGTVGAAHREAIAEADVARADANVARREVRHRVVVAWVQLARAGGDVVATSIAAQQAAELELIAKGRLSAGEGADVDVTVAGAARARAEVAAKAAQRTEDAASAELAGVLGWDPARRLRAAGTIVTADVAGDDDVATLRRRLAAHPERAAAERRVSAAEATLDRVLEERWPTLALDGEILYDDQTITEGRTAWDRTDAMIGLTFDLPLFARVGDKARAARATESAQRARLAVTETELAAGLVAAFRRWQAASERLRSLERDVVPAQERAAALSAQAYREGARDLAYALQAERDLASLRAEVNGARADAAEAYADLQLAVGDEVGR